nr:ABC transporter permease [Acetatifactor aquisgranensis]
MKSLKYQLKSIRRDKLCLLTFLLPIVVGLAINLLSGVDFDSLGETSFGVLEGQISQGAAAWLQASGTVTRYGTEQALREAVNEPSTQMIGVLEAGEGIRTFLSGDELEVTRVTADTLPRLYDNRAKEACYPTAIHPASTENEGLKSLLIVITLVTAMFMGCTFNAMNIITEKEDGIIFINRILPMTAGTYMVQKMLLGFLGGTLSTVLTALVCMRIAPAQLLSLFLIVLLSAFIAALTRRKTAGSMRNGASPPGNRPWNGSCTSAEK